MREHIARPVLETSMYDSGSQALSKRTYHSIPVRCASEHLAVELILLSRLDLVRRVKMIRMGGSSFNIDKSSVRRDSPSRAGA